MVLLARSHVLHDRTLCLRVMQTCMFWDDSQYESWRVPYKHQLPASGRYGLHDTAGRHTLSRGRRMLVPKSLQRTTSQSPELLLLAPPHLPGRGQGISVH